MRTTRLALASVLLFSMGCGEPCPDFGSEVFLFPGGGTLDAPELVFEATWSGRAPRDLTFIVETDGAVVEGETFREAGRAWFEPEAAFEDDHTYDVGLEWSCGDTAQRIDGQPIRTHAFVQAVAEPDAVTDTVFASPGDSFRILEPSGDLGAVLEPTLHMVWLPLLHIKQIDASGSLEASLFWADPYSPDVPIQRPCSLPNPLSTGEFTNPEFHFPATDIEVVTGLGSARVYDLVLDGSLSSDGQGVGELVFSGQFDIRDLTEELGYGTDYGTFCSDARQLGHPCTPCPDGPTACLSMTIGEVQATAQAVALVHDDVCDIEGGLALWNTDHLYRTQQGSTWVERLEYDGTVTWAIDVGEPIVRMVASPLSEHTPRIVFESGATTGWTDLRPTDGATLATGVGQRGGTGVSNLVDLILDFSAGGCGAQCSTVPAVPRQLSLLVALSLVLVRRRSGRSS